jgi:hypothetical protein
MAYHVTHVFGEMDTPGLEDLSAVLDELANADQEHADVALSHESGWTLSVSAGGRLILENVEQRATERHMSGLEPLGRDKNMIIGLWTSLAQGNVDHVIGSVSWQPGYR